MKLYPYQARDVEKAIAKAKQGGVLNGSAMGAGKTLFGVDLANRVTRRDQQVLIVAPLNTLDGWARTVDEHVGIRLRKISSVSGENIEYHAMKEFMKGVPGWYFVGWETATRLEYAKFRCATVIFDEIHRACSYKAAHNAGSNAHMAYTVGRGVAARKGWRIGLSGTWKGNKEEGAWAVIRAIWSLTTERSFHRWAKKHLAIGSEWLEIRGELTELKVLGDELDSGSIVRSLPHYIRHEENSRCCKFHPEGVQADLPKRVTHQVGVDLNPAQRLIYDALEKDMFAWIEANKYPISSEGYPMVNLIRLYQVCLAVPSTELARRLKTDNRTGERVLEEYIAVKYALTAQSSKIDAIYEIVADIPPDEAIVVYTHSAGIIPVIVARLNKAGGRLARPAAMGWHGSISQADRQQIKTDFLAGTVRIIVAQVASIGEGTDGLQARCHNEIWASLSTNRLINTQARKRLHRPGQKHIINSWEIYARETLEQGQYLDQRTKDTKMQKGLKKHG